MELALWYFTGEFVPQDLAAARQGFRRAGEAGHADAELIYISFLASGTGGAAEWDQAVSLLRRCSARMPLAEREIRLIEAMNLDRRGKPQRLGEREPLSTSPQAWLLRNFLTANECEYLIDVCEPRFRPSLVVDPNTGRHVPHPVRLSDGASFPWISETPFIHALNLRIAAATETEVSAGEPLQVLRYRPGQEFKPHHDADYGDPNPRIWTMLVYLNEDYTGGETEFVPSGLRVKGRKGDALLFRSINDNGQVDPSATHAGTPVKTGAKYIASRWIRQRTFGPPRQ
jgi:prolyl 4-hydroxylase